MIEIERQGSGVRGYAVQADCERATDSASKIVSEAKICFQEGIDIIVNNAADGSDISLGDLTAGNFDRIFHTNVLFPMLLVQQSWRHLRKNVRVVNISSTSARGGKRSRLN